MNFTDLVYTEAVKAMQEQFGSRSFNEKISNQEAKTIGEGEKEFITTRDSFFMSTVGENGWPYMQHRGGPKGFLKLLGNETLAFADFGGNRQYISAGNIKSSQKTMLFLMNYPTKQRLKIWAESEVFLAEEMKALLPELIDPNYKARVERVVLLKVIDFEWNCQQHIEPRFSIDELQQIFRDNPAIKDAFMKDL